MPNNFQSLAGILRCLGLCLADCINNIMIVNNADFPTDANGGEIWREGLIFNLGTSLTVSSRYFPMPGHYIMWYHLTFLACNFPELVQWECAQNLPGCVPLVSYQTRASPNTSIEFLPCDLWKSGDSSCSAQGPARIYTEEFTMHTCMALACGRLDRVGHTTPPPPLPTRLPLHWENTWPPL